MPELPEVEINKRSLWQHIEAGTLATPILHRTDILKILSPDLSIASLNGASIVSLDRRGKYLILTAHSKRDGDLLLIIHFRMTGKLLFNLNAELPLPLQKHSHLVFPFVTQHGQAAHLIWHDVRRFGTMELIRKQEFARSKHTILRLGPEPFDPAFNAEYLLHQAKRHPKLKLPTFFLNQSVVAGLGNIYVNEAFFYANLHPELLASQLKTSDYEKLILIFRHILQRSIDRGGTSFRDYLDTDGRSGLNQTLLTVYGRDEHPCVRCGTTLSSVVIGGRRNVYCPSCQPYQSNKSKKGKKKMLFLASGYSSRSHTNASAIRAFSFDSKSGFKSIDRDFGDLKDMSYIIHDISTTKVHAVEESNYSALTTLDLTTTPPTLSSANLEHGSGACHLCFWGPYLFTANYGSGSISVLRYDNGETVYLGEIQHVGSSINLDRQSSPHAHWVGISADKRFLFAIDLGCDALYTYDLSDIENKIDQLESVHAKFRYDFPAGSGPRHLVMSPDGEHAYVAGELTAELFVLKYSDGRFSAIEDHDVSRSVEEDPLSSDEIAPAAIRSTTDGRFILISVRGTDRLWAFARESTSGHLTLVDHQHVGSIWPRDFNILDDGRTIIVACERSNELRAMSLDPKTGKLSQSEHRIEMTAPSCILPL